MNEKINLLIHIGFVPAYIKNSDKEEISDASAIREFQKALDEAGKLMVGLFEKGIGETTTVYMLAALAGLKGVKKLARVFEGFVTKEFICRCFYCKEEVYVWPRGEVLKIAGQNPVSNKKIKWHKILPTKVEVNKWSGKYQRKNAPEWLIFHALKCEEHLFIAMIPYLFGIAECPLCKKKFELSTQIEEY